MVVTKNVTAEPVNNEDIEPMVYDNSMMDT
jgi:hypothetical protein